MSLFLISSTGQSQNCTGHLSVEYTTSAFLLRDNFQLAAFPGCGVWITVDFDSKNKILRVKLGPMGKKEVQNILIQNIKF